MEVFQISTEAGCVVDVLVRRDPSGDHYAFARYDCISTGSDFDRLYDACCERCGYQAMVVENRGRHLRLRRPRLEEVVLRVLLDREDGLETLR